MISLRHLVSVISEKVVEALSKGQFLLAQGKNKQKEKDALLFIGFHLQARISRISSEIKEQHRERKIILICHHKGVSEKFVNNSFSQIILFKNKWELAKILLKYESKSCIYHFFEPKCRYAAFIHNLLHIKIIFDFQDVYVTYYGTNPPVRWIKKDLKHEKYLLTNSSGIIACSLETQEAYRLYKVKKEIPNLFFLPYCNERVFVKKSTDKIANLSIVYAGGISSGNSSQSDSEITNFFPLIQILTKQEISFHLYPSPSTPRAVLEEYSIESSANPFFKLHTSVKQSELAKELSQYHFGILPFFHNEAWDKSSKMRYAVSLKLFNFLEAGLPILVSSDLEFQHWLIMRYQAGKSISNLEDLKNLKEFESADYAQLLHNVETARNAYSLQKNLPRLLDFYTSAQNR